MVNEFQTAIKMHPNDTEESIASPPPARARTLLSLYFLKKNRILEKKEMRKGKYYYLCIIIKSDIYENKQKFNYMPGSHCIDSM